MAGSRQAGATLGPYRIIQQVGLGGMATVYKAYQPNMERYVALKVLPEHYARDPKFVQRFLQEVRTIARLEHPHILPVHDFGEENGITYLAMRYLESGTLKDVLEAGHLTLADAARILEQVSSALDYAHRQGVVHRDVKPTNIMIDEEGEAYLTDFGIAKVLESSERLTGTGAALGTPAYMAPEQSLGKEVDGRADIYALGIILYEMVVGRVPYQADTPMAIALAHVHQPLPLPRAVDPGIPEVIEAVILKALAKDPDDRYQTASQFAAALNEAIEEAAVDASQSRLRALAHEARLSRIQEMATFDSVPEGRFTPTSVERTALQRYWPLLVGGLIAAVAAILFVVLGRDAIGLLATDASAVEEAAEAPADSVAPTDIPAAPQTPRPTEGPTTEPTREVLTPDGYLERTIEAAQADPSADFALAALRTVANRQPTYQDDFSDPSSGHVQITGGDAIARYEDGVYVMGNGGGGITISENFTDVVVQLDMSLDRFGDANPSWGQFFVRDNGISHYGFEVNGYEGRVSFQLGKGDSGGYSMIASELRPPDSDLSLGSWHNMIGLAVSDQLAFFADGVLLLTVTDDGAAAGQISIGSGGRSLLRVDNLRIWDVSDLE